MGKYINFATFYSYPAMVQMMNDENLTKENVIHIDKNINKNGCQITLIYEIDQ